MAPARARHSGSVGRQDSPHRSLNDGFTSLLTTLRSSTASKSQSSRKRQYITSEDSEPQSFSSSQLSRLSSASPPPPPVLSSALLYVIDVWTNRSPLSQPWSTYSLNPQEYELLERLRESDEFGLRKARYDYSAVDETLALRMAVFETHEVLIGRIVSHINNSLKANSSRKKGKKGLLAHSRFAKSVVARGSSTISYPHPFQEKSEISREPDYSWSCEDQKYPSVILEVAHLQTTKSLEKLAREYIIGTRAAVRTVLGVDIDAKRKEAQVSIWRPKFDDQQRLADIQCVTQEIRNKDGSTCADEKTFLRLTLRDFACHRVESEYGGLEDVDMSIDIDQLCKMLEAAEKQQQLGSGGQGEWDQVPLAPSLSLLNQPSHDYALRSRGQV